MEEGQWDSASCRRMGPAHACDGCTSWTRRVELPWLSYEGCHLLGTLEVKLLSEAVKDRRQFIVLLEAPLVLNLSHIL